MTSQRRVLVTGGAGFIGHHLIDRLLDDTATRVTVVVNSSRGHDISDIGNFDADRVRVIEADLTDPGVWDGIGGGYHEVYHLAAVIGVRNVLGAPQDVVRVNAIATLHLLDWFVAGGGEKILFSSTSEAYAWTQHFHTLPIPTPEAVPLALTDLRDPRSSYAGSKIFGELAVTQYCQAAEKPFVILRYHNVYGPRMGLEHVIPELFARARSGQNPLTVYSANHRRAFCYVSDAVNATVAAMHSNRADNETLNVGNDREEITIGDLAKRILERVGGDVRVQERPAVNDPIPRRCPDISRARELLGYEPRIDLDAGLTATLAWYEKWLSGSPVPATGRGHLALLERRS
jgi:UDP-glucose 4-epimerase/UDP-glucuronate decarboxylase